ncbi:MAG: hypothetical protein HC869_25260 [Rhodospirillales bacterium]|nr:hypothetical protein [Rhodospirillales bacterium]
MAADSYEDARTIAAAASPNQFILQPYTGTTNDLSYLRNWVLNHVTAIYSVSADVFDTATVYSTSILRDFVHRALYQIAASGAPARPPNDISIISTTPQFLVWEDVALGFRYPAYGLCDLLAWQLWEVYRSFGYQTNDIATYNDAFGLSTDSHVTTQVYVSDIDKYIVQDATYNFIYRDADESILSFYEAQQEIHNGGGLAIDGFSNYRWYYYDGASEAQLRAAMQEYIEAHYLDVMYWWWDTDGVRHQLLTDLFVDSATAHDSGKQSGARFASEDAATTRIEQFIAQSLGWTAIAQALRNDGYYVSGFAFADAAGTRTSEWITVRLSDGSYISIELQSETVLNGSYDQLASEATGGTVRNPGADLTGFLNPFYMLASTAQS